jgi:hypothetical protein
MTVKRTVAQHQSAPKGQKENTKMAAKTENKPAEAKPAREPKKMNECLLTGNPCKGAFAGLGTDAKAKSLIIKYLTAKANKEALPQFGGEDFVPSKKLMAYAQEKWGPGTGPDIDFTGEAYKKKAKPAAEPKAEKAAK